MSGARKAVWWNPCRVEEGRGPVRMLEGEVKGRETEEKRGWARAGDLPHVGVLSPGMTRASKESH